MPYKHPESFKLWKERNKSKCREYQREYHKGYRKTHPDMIQNVNKKWRTSHPEKARMFSLNRIVFLGKRFGVGFRQLTGYCSNCKRNIYNGSCKATHMHHLKYIPCMPWACRQELCPSCHGLRR